MVTAVPYSALKEARLQGVLIVVMFYPAVGDWPANMAGAGVAVAAVDWGIDVDSAAFR